MVRNIDTLHLFDYQNYEENFSDKDSDLHVLLICQLPYLRDASIAPREENYTEILQTDLEKEENLQENKSLAQTLSYVHVQASIAIRNAACMPIFKNYLYLIQLA